MKPKANLVAQRLVNLYRQEHVILGGWAALNPVFVQEATDDVLDEMADLPTGKLLVQHIKNLRSGKTPMDSIERDLLPYGGLMGESGVSTPMSNEQWHELSDALNNFVPNQQGLENLQKLDVVKKFGDEWLVGIKNMLSGDTELAEKWKVVMQTWRAYHLWDMATQIINQPLTERMRAQIQADMPEYETFLPMFAEPGNQLLAKLRSFMSDKKRPSSTEN